MTIWCGGILRSITRNAHAIAVAVTAIVIEGQWFSRKCLADIGPARLLPTLRRGDRELRKLSHVRRLVRHSKIRVPMSALGQKRTFMHFHMMSALLPKADIECSAAKCPLCARSRHRRMSAPCRLIAQKQTFTRALAHRAYFEGGGL